MGPRGRRFGESSPAGGRVWWRRGGLTDQTVRKVRRWRPAGEACSEHRGTHCAQRDGRELGASGCGEPAPKVGPGHEEAPAGGRAQRRPGE